MIPSGYLCFAIYLLYRERPHFKAATLLTKGIESENIYPDSNNHQYNSVEMN